MQKRETETKKPCNHSGNSQELANNHSLTTSPGLFHGLEKMIAPDCRYRMLLQDCCRLGLGDFSEKTLSSYCFSEGLFSQITKKQTECSITIGLSSCFPFSSKPIFFAVLRERPFFPIFYWFFGIMRSLALSLKKTTTWLLIFFTILLQSKQTVHFFYNKFPSFLSSHPLCSPTFRTQGNK